MKKDLEDLKNSLYDILASLGSSEDVKVFLDDLCTYREVEQMAQRLEAAKLLMDGMTYSQVIELTDVSSATLSRVSRCVQYGKGYKKVIEEQLSKPVVLKNTEIMKR